ncbi:chromosome segregation protein [Richelia sinica FACHB-800]|uniref:Chromosome segregation protein n=1 Tax=Richelia sinica FACHB-800 TaxID=1357546 RepID=A0A975T9F8_9NOST|nr:hypothetical protein [Richelia sinica]MBD2663370.1 hypothetical protein [Richelia sinica FACHB-800]QXE24544.1 chromosome segregation protein [Richelia sinica FACHB-800]
MSINGICVHHNTSIHKKRYLLQAQPHLSSFYAFDEVDRFLDGANVERLARIIKQQAQQAQFIVVSLRRPMIESAERKIGVTQA